MQLRRSYLSRVSAMAALLFMAALAPLAAYESGEGEPDSLQDVMETMGRTLRKLKRQIEDSSRLESSKKMLATMKECATKALQLEPPSDEERTGEAHEKWIAKYKEMIGGVIKTIDEAQAALEESQFNVAAARLSEILEKRKKGHEVFDVDED